MFEKMEDVIEFKSGKQLIKIGLVELSRSDRELLVFLFAKAQLHAEKVKEGKDTSFKETDALNIETTKLLHRSITSVSFGEEITEAPTLDNIDMLAGRLGPQRVSKILFALHRIGTLEAEDIEEEDEVEYATVKK